jgi:DNA-directed RNA polymerase specialized sigma24 family protein
MPRREITTAALPDVPALSSPETTLEISERTRAVHKMLMSLPLSQRIAMAWTADGFSVTEIAKATSTTPAAVRKNLQRARAAMKLLLGRRNDEGGAR